MARAVFQCELNDPDFQWLISSFMEHHPGYFMLESSSLPLVLMKADSVLLAEAGDQISAPPSAPLQNDESDILEGLLKPPGK